MAEQCTWCKKFIGKKRIVFTPYGSSIDIEPPEEGHLCEKCWNELTIKEKGELYARCWQKPTKIGFGEA